VKPINLKQTTLILTNRFKRSRKETFRNKQEAYRAKRIKKYKI
jgi:hypothetical protein